MKGQAQELRATDQICSKLSIDEAAAAEQNQAIYGCCRRRCDGPKTPRNRVYIDKFLK